MLQNVAIRLTEHRDCLDFAYWAGGGYAACAEEGRGVNGLRNSEWMGAHSGRIGIGSMDLEASVGMPIEFAHRTLLDEEPCFEVFPRRG